MTTYKIQPRGYGPDGYLADAETVSADTYDEAATAFAKRRHGRHAFARRVTGLPGRSGLYAPYVSQKDRRAWHKVGTAFHVMSLE